MFRYIFFVSTVYCSPGRNSAYSLSLTRIGIVVGGLPLLAVTVFLLTLKNLGLKSLSSAYILSMSTAIFIPESRLSTSSESQLLEVHDYSFATTRPSRRSKWEWLSLVLRAIFMLVFTLAFVSGSLMTVMVFDSVGNGWIWKEYVAAWGLLVVVALLDLLFICATVRLMREMFPYARPSIGNDSPNCNLLCSTLF